MLTAINFLEDNEQGQIYDITPGEGSVPLSIFRDKYSEELAYPGIFVGQRRPENHDRLVDVHYSDNFFCKWTRKPHVYALWTYFLSHAKSL